MRLAARPQVGKALSVAVSDGASALAGVARSVGGTYTAKIPKALIVQLEKIGLASLKRTRMGNVVGKEYRFLEAASEFIVPFFKQELRITGKGVRKVKGSEKRKDHCPP